jgi:hypothetical protein
MDIRTKEACTRFVGQLLGEQNQLHKRRPFLWKATDDHHWFPDPFLENKAMNFKFIVPSFHVRID